MRKCDPPKLAGIELPKAGTASFACFGKTIVLIVRYNSLYYLFDYMFNNYLFIYSKKY